MDLQLKGRRALVTGSSSGIGEGIARMLAEEGVKVVVHGRNRERAENVAAQIGAVGVATGDLSSDEAAAAVQAEACVALGGNIEILVNNAGGSSTGNTTKAPIEISTQDYISNYHANALASVRLCQLVVSDMTAARFGRIINVSSAVAVQPNNLGADYSSAKAALNNFTVSLAGALRGVGITVNTLSPGIIMVDGLLRFGRQKYGNPNLTIDEVTKRLADDKVFALPPAGRLGTPQDLAIIACTLASPLSGFITGANYRVDGGQVRGLN
ncbi:SDR family NAD(P)-dependent oxidoreductase [Sphingobium sp. BYY-5]|uniref:SDR family NAD(P)-dependent oxidoreductase n=1 Tax=Sphingobium sp. BYY-5 TaxID=2926400 RepID=UPI001FA6C780|nr:SDR family NAD(P)-dependent oxidoreductase [Sphingobium sp. BYY-5]MCI4592295.1 SDR family NAD(P)-dependent oxidoreductase [Sphingobium sp. BYY-5]